MTWPGAWRPPWSTSRSWTPALSQDQVLFSSKQEIILMWTEDSVMQDPTWPRGSLYKINVIFYKEGIVGETLWKLKTMLSLRMTYQTSYKCWIRLSLVHSQEKGSKIVIFSPINLKYSAGRTLVGAYCSTSLLTITGLVRSGRPSCTTTLQMLLTGGIWWLLLSLTFISCSLDARSRKIFPGLFTLLNILYWVSYLYVF